MVGSSELAFVAGERGRRRMVFLEVQESKNYFDGKGEREHEGLNGDKENAQNSRSTRCNSERSSTKASKLDLKF